MCVCANIKIYLDIKKKDSSSLLSNVFFENDVMLCGPVICNVDWILFHVM